MAKPDRPKVPVRERLRQLREVYRVSAARDSRLTLIVAGSALAPIAVLLVLGLVIGHPILLTILGVLIAWPVAMAVFYRRVTRSAMAEVEGQPGAAASVLTMLRGDWQVTPAVGFTTAQDLVHRVVGRPGVVLVGEGNPTRVRGLIAQERKRVARVVGEVPVHEVLVGNEDGEIPLRKLQMHIMRLPRALRPNQTSEVKQRLRALGAAQPPIPRGPMPRPGRMPRGGKLR